MRKILIISYFFPPSNFVGGERTHFWCKNLYNEGIYPIIITRKWNKNQKDIIGKIEDNSEKNILNQKFQIIEMPYIGGNREMYAKYTIIRKFYSLLNKIKILVKPKSVLFNNLYFKARDIIKENAELTHVIISGRPFEAFYFGYKLKKEFPRIQWIPDYRDQWTTHPDQNKFSLTYLVNRIHEKKWISNSSYFITTSETWKKNIEILSNKPGHVIINGFTGNVKSNPEFKPKNKITIGYIGSLYKSQNIEAIFKALVKINGHSHLKFKLLFVGIEAVPSMPGLIRSYSKKHCVETEILERVPKSQINEILSRTDIFLLTAFNKVKGWLPVKAFEYAKELKPIICFPADEDVIDEFILRSGLGFSFNDENEFVNFFENFRDLKDFKLKSQPNIPFIKSFNRENQVKTLGNLITKH